ncbi:MAG: hypothetical protein PVG90_14105, partial [Bacillota bacterium]
IAIRNFPEEQREKLLKEFDTTKPEGVKTMITHLGQNFKRYFNEAEKKGEIKGILKGKREVEEKTIRMAQNLLAMGIAVETVAKAAELPVEKILELQKPRNIKSYPELITNQ